jgi:hypothetical protein
VKTFTFEADYGEDGGGRCDVVVAPGLAEAQALAGKQILDDNGWTLADEGYDGFEEFYDERMKMLHTSEDLDGAACPNCTSHGGRDTQIEHGGGTIRECSACAFQWVPLGFSANRKLMERAAQEALDSMKADEIESLGEEAVECQNCTWHGHAGSLKEIKDYSQRVGPSEPAPAGECPKCGCLAQFIEKEESE